MNKPVLYSSAPKSRFLAALLCAAAIHLSAVALATVHHQPPANPSSESIDVVGDDAESGPPSPPDDTSSPPSVPDPAVEFTDTQVPVPKIREKTMPIRPRAAAISSAAIQGPARTLALNAPRPEYPYEARSRRITGTGTVVVNVDASGGFVIDASMAQSTGNSILDNSALSAFRRW